MKTDISDRMQLPLTLEEYLTLFTGGIARNDVTVRNTEKIIKYKNKNLLRWHLHTVHPYVCLPLFKQNNDVNYLPYTVALVWA